MERLRFPSGSEPSRTPGKDGSDRDAMTAFRLGRVAVPRATEPSLAQPAVVARSRSPALALRLGLAGVAVASAVVRLVLFDEADPALWVPGYWPVRELLSAAIAFSSVARYSSKSQGALARRGLIDLRTACRVQPAVGRALVGRTDGGWRARRAAVGDEWHCDRPLPWTVADGAASALPDGPLPGRLWKVLLVVSAGLVVIATLAAQYNFPTIDNLAEWYFWSTVVGLGWLIALVSLIVRWLRGARGALGQVIAIAPEHQTVVAIGSVPAGRR